MNNECIFFSVHRFTILYSGSWWGPANERLVGYLSCVYCLGIWRNNINYDVRVFGGRRDLSTHQDKKWVTFMSFLYKCLSCKVPEMTTIGSTKSTFPGIVWRNYRNLPIEYRDASRWWCLCSVGLKVKCSREVTDYLCWWSCQFYPYTFEGAIRFQQSI